MSNEVSTESGVKPQPGDLIEIFRGSYQHWAVYIGDGLVVHLAPPSENPGAGAYSMMSIVCDRARVTWAGFWDVVGTDEWRTNNILDDQCEPRSADLVVQEARRLVGTELPYSVFTSNCEHFATDLRYGKAQSRQGWHWDKSHVTEHDPEVRQAGSQH
ncbi:unnamed protein product, partial [Gadus morhua 'NCC']